MKRLFYRLLLGLLPFTLWAQTSNPVWFKTPLAPRLANYEIEAYVNPAEHALKGSLKLTWKNAGTEATDKLPLHLYLNAFKGPNSIFMREVGGAYGVIAWETRMINHLGAIVVSSLFD